MSTTAAMKQLEQGEPLACLAQWRQQLLESKAACQRHLLAARQGLSSDPIAPLRRQAISLAEALLDQEPAQEQQQQLGQLLHGWGELCLLEAPQRAQQHLERAWICAPNPKLEAQLAGLYTQQGMADGALALSASPSPGPWPWLEPPCPSLCCQSCQQQLEAGVPLGHHGPPRLAALPQGQIWLQRRSNAWQQTHGLAVADSQGHLQPSFCRRYPTGWPHCPKAANHQQQAVAQMQAQLAANGPPHQCKGAVLAVADLSAEIYYHWLLECLPRLGWSWQQLQQSEPKLMLWHNGGNAPWVKESLARLGVPPERCLCSSRHPHIQAERLLVPHFHAPFGAPPPWSVAWLQNFWQLPQRSTPANQRFYLPRGHGVSRRPLLGEGRLRQALHEHGWQQLPKGLSVAEQLQCLSHSRQLLAPHGAALAGVLALPQGSRIDEWLNPGYTPPYFHSLSRCVGAEHHRHLARPTPEPLQEWLYAGPLAWPIDPGPNPLHLLP